MNLEFVIVFASFDVIKLDDDDDNSDEHDDFTSSLLISILQTSQSRFRITKILNLKMIVIMRTIMMIWTLTSLTMIIDWKFLMTKSTNAIEFIVQELRQRFRKIHLVVNCEIEIKFDKLF